MGLQICSTSSIENGLLVTKTSEYFQGVIDTSGNEILSPGYSAIRVAEDGSYILTLGYENGSGFVRMFSPSGKQLDEIINDSVSETALSSRMGGIESNCSGWNVWFGKLGSVSGEDTFSIEVSDGHLNKVAPAWGGSSESVKSFTARNGDKFALIGAQDGSYLEYGGKRTKLTSAYFGCNRIGDIIQACVKQDYDSSTPSVKREYKYYWYNGEEIPQLSANSQTCDLASGERYLALKSDTKALDLLDSDASVIDAVQQNVIDISCPRQLTKREGDAVTGAVCAVAKVSNCEAGPVPSTMIVDYSGVATVKVSDYAYMVDGHPEYIIDADESAGAIKVYYTSSFALMGLR